ncbi:TIGR04222 domain-containing membrane protein [Streptomyces sp. NBC_01142]|uniref:TIGR04222 domain-containing membrane protein n=1 Tax=Streptomyces sp. NBC_01142 TaxID=2975865 RepID=UPI0022549A69|nr:TIGR04222 domain-containing membrane protein [Streptomyces sp. NBC_01142]MCX4820003.1 TIGR04222 domain-containing membrane protein [Streptomyces sp. NBC_01142]
MLWVLFLLVAWAVAGITCARLCLAAVEAARPAPEGPGLERQLSLYEAAFLAGGPQRVAELTLVSMHRRRTLLLAHTGWTTVVDPEGEDDLERSVLGAIGPAGQARTAAVRAAASAADAVRALADRLVGAGLAVPDAARSHVASAVRAVQGAAALTLALAAATLLMLPQEQGSTVLVIAWFALPLLLTLGCLAIARIEVYPYTRWASPDGQRLLGSLSPRSDGDERALLTAVAVQGVGALDDPALRAALTGGRMAHRSH